jgi:uncharacterized DUF497 family protein
MRIVWDEPKRLANLERHGLDFRDLTVEFFLESFVRPAKNGRFQAIGRFQGVVSVVFARLGSEGVSVISMRPASRNERRLI